MRIFKKIIVLIVFLPTLILGVAIALTRTIFDLTILMAWDKSCDWHKDMILYLNESIKDIKES